MYKRIKHMTASEKVSLAEANERLAKFYTSIFWNEDSGKFMWTSFMCDSHYFDSLREAYNDAVDYINNYGC